MFNIGQKVCLWQLNFMPGHDVQVQKEVIVEIIETKTGVPGEFSREPVSAQSLRGCAEDGTIYEKHWESWPESQTNDFLGQWTMRDDGAGDNWSRFWAPFEAVYAYNHIASRRRKNHTPIWQNGEPAIPKGDVDHCLKHDQYLHKGSPCFWCTVEEQGRERIAGSLAQASV